MAAPICTLVERYGAEVVKAVMRRTVDAGEKLFVERLKSIPDGTWSHRACTETDVPGDKGIYPSHPAAVSPAGAFTTEMNINAAALAIGRMMGCGDDTVRQHIPGPVVPHAYGVIYAGAYADGTPFIMINSTASPVPEPAGPSPTASTREASTGCSRRSHTTSSTPRRRTRAPTLSPDGH